MTYQLSEEYSLTPLDAGLLSSASADGGPAAMWAEFAGWKWPAPVYACQSCASTFEPAWDLAGRGKLPEWGAVLAVTQSGGRGQLRRPWLSPPGNLYVSFRLPAGGIFSGEASSVLAGLMICRAFEELGLNPLLKWPNDLVLDGPAGPAKVGGLLLEERGGLILAGLGVNISQNPPAGQLRAGAALGAGTLPAAWAHLSGPALWKSLVGRIMFVYYTVLQVTSEARLLAEAEKRLLWLGRDVFIHESSVDAPVRGRLTGLGPRGGIVLLLQENGRTVEKRFFSGSLGI